MSARVRLPECLKTLLRSEMETAIKEANLGKLGTRIASQYLIEQVPQIDIALEMGIDRSTISRTLPYILERVEQAARKLGMLD